MGDTLSVTFSDIYMKKKMERDAVRSFDPVFYCRYVDNIYNRQSIKRMTFLKL